MSERAPRKVQAWFIPGNQVERWLNELVRCGLAEVDTRLYVVPCSQSDRSAAGILAVPSNESEGSASPSGFGCCWIGKRLCVPADADLSPPLSAEEADALCGDTIVLLHPTLGASRFAPEDFILLWQLLVAPSLIPSSWNQSRLGPSLHPDLTQITLLSPPRIEEVFGNVPDTIGNLPLSELAQLAHDPGPSAPTLADKLKDLVARGIEGIAGQATETPGSKEWANPLSDWARRRCQQEEENLQAARQQELQRLLSQLEENPEAGLQYAIPIANLPHRGLAPSRSRLGARLPDYNARKLGGEAADFWETPADVQAKLRRTYTELANRELRLMNFRRAAYIFAHLLGDFASAANALKQGKHFREAAVLYEERLQSPAQAAQCLEEGELLQDALQLYQKLGTKNDIARIHEKRGDQRAAHEVWQQMVNEYCAEQDYLEAAKLLEEKLGLPDEAARRLQEAWPDSPQSLPCLHALFELWSKRGTHERAIEFLHRTLQAKGSFWKQEGFLEILVQQARRYPDPAVRKVTANLCLVTISRRFQESRLSVRTVSRLAGHLAELAPTDRLLCRDTNRYLSKRRQSGGSVSRPNISRDNETASKSSKTDEPSGHPTPQLPPGVRWLSFKAVCGGFYGLGTQGNESVLVRSSWAGIVQQVVRVPGIPRRSLGEFLFEPIPPEGQQVILRLFPEQRLSPVRWPMASPAFPFAASLYTPSWLPASANAVCATPDGIWAIVIANQTATVQHYQLTGELRGTWDLGQLFELDGDWLASQGCCITAAAKKVAVGMGHRVFLLNPDGNWDAQPMSRPVRQLVIDESVTTSTVLAALEEGVWFCHRGSEFSSGMVDTAAHLPIVARILPKTFLVQSGTECRVLRLEDEEQTLCLQISTQERRILAAFPIEATREFALLDEAGRMTRHRLPSTRA